MSQRQPRTFDSLRAREGVVEIARPDGIEAAMKDLALTPDGRHLQAWLKYEMRRPTHPGASADQLREAEGARRAYDRLLDMMEANTPVR